jgi:hypothetical protein
MYPSGRWRGHWQQPLWGRQPMHDLVLHFSSGRVEGRGADIVGPFTFQGEYDDGGNIVLVKQYLRRHRVLYRGRWDGEGAISGEWNIGEVRGPFALAPEGLRADADAPILSVTAPLPRSAPKRIAPAPVPVGPDED